jgi:hypothetical protein
VTAKAEPRTWVQGDNEPADCWRLVDSWGCRWFPLRDESGERTRRWRSRTQSEHDASVTWWWLTMYRGPLTEVLP